jgi:hypothetical protein
MREAENKKTEIFVFFLCEQCRAVSFTNIFAPYGRIYLEFVAVDLPTISTSLSLVKIGLGHTKNKKIGITPDFKRSRYAIYIIVTLAAWSPLLP